MLSIYTYHQCNVRLYNVFMIFCNLIFSIDFNGIVLCRCFTVMTPLSLFTQLSFLSPSARLRLHSLRKCTSSSSTEVALEEEEGGVEVSKAECLSPVGLSSATQTLGCLSLSKVY